jgi:hypothetical protein
MRGIPPPPHTSWPQFEHAQSGAAIALPITEESIFKIPETMRVTMLAAAPAHRAEQVAPVERETENPARPLSARSRAAASPQSTRPRHAAHQHAHVGHADRSAPKHAIQVKKNTRTVRVAALKKR